MALTTEAVGISQPAIRDTGSSFGGEDASFQAEITRQSQAGPLGGGRPILLASASTLSAPIAEGIEFALPRLAPGVLGTLATGVAAAVPVLVVPTNSSHLQQGALPGHPDIGYRYYESESGMRFYRMNPDGSEGPTLWQGERSRVQRPDGSLAVNAEGLRRIAAGENFDGPIGFPGAPWPPLPPLITTPVQEPVGAGPAVGGGFRPEELDLNTLPGPDLDQRPLDTTLPGSTPVEQGPTILMSAAGDLVDLTGKTRAEAEQILKGAGFQHTGTSAGGYENYRHPDGSRVYVRPDGEVIRTPPPEYAADGRRTNKGARIGPDGQPTTSHNTGEIVKN